MDLLVDVGLDPDVRCSWARLTEYLPTTDVLQTLKSSKTLTELVLDGVEAVTDEVFFMLQRERLGFSITHVSCIGCIHITDYGVSLLAQAAPALKTVVFDGCPQLTAASLYHLSRSCKQLSSVSARGSSITHMPIPIPLAPDGLLACPLITDDANYIEPTKSKRYKIAIFVKNTIKTSVLSFLTSGFFDKQAEKNDLITYHSDVTLDNVVDFTFNIIECHLPRGMYSPFLSARGAYIFAMDLGTVENPLVHLNTLTSCIRGQVVNSTVQVLCLHCGQPEEYAGIVDLAEGLRLAEIRQKDTISQGLDDMYSHEYNPNIKIDREMITQVRHMRGRKHFSGRLVINIFAVNTENLEVEIVWPKRDTTGNIVTETEGEKQLNSAPAEVDVDADNMFSQINTGYSAEDLYAEMEDLQEQANRLLDEAAVDLVRINGHLSSLNKKDISEIKSFKTPPIQIGTCMGVLAILLGYPSDRKLGHVQEPADQDHTVL